MTAINTRFYTLTERKANNKIDKNKVKVKDTKEKLNNISWYGGKRFLGLTKDNNPVYVRYKLIKDSLSLQLEFSHKLSSIKTLANDRYTFDYNESVVSNNLMTRKLRKKRGGEVTQQTLHYLQRLKNLVDGKFIKGFNKGKPTKLMFKYIADSIHVGNDITQHDIMEHWNLPSSEYFVPEQTWKYPDEL
tara:strand:- start:67 stop:633 length:567 start_codon:yes stop_codon:yes gene_type:complete